MQKPNDIVAEMEVIFEFRGLRKPGSIWIGKPYLRSPGDWRCASGFDGIDEYWPHVAGGNAFHSLCLSFLCLQFQIKQLLNKEWKIYITRDQHGNPKEIPFDYNVFFVCDFS